MTCGPLDFVCQLQDMLAGVVAVVLLILVAIFVLPRFGKKGALLAILVIFGIAWWYGFIPFLPALRGLLGG